MSGLRSDGWLSGDDEVAMAHRVALRSSGLTVGRGGRPVVGIANSWSDLNPCNLPLRALAGAVRDGIEDAGGIPAEFGTISLGEDLMKPTAMLYRNLLAIEVEEMIRSYPLDGIVILANCDKSVPGAIMGAASADIPAVVVTGGAREPAVVRGQRIGSGTALWRLWDERRAGQVTDADWRDLESCLACGPGACNTMGTASTMALMAEALGLMIPGSSTIPAGDPAAPGAAREAGRCAVASVGKDLRPSVVLSPAAFGNAIRVLHAAGGSTNAVIHLAAIAGRVGVPLPLDDIGRLGAGVPVLADVQPPGGAIRRRRDPLRTGGAFAVVRGSLAPQGAVIKVSAASPELLAHRGPALVFHGYGDMRSRVDDPDLPVTPGSVLILTGCGPVGVPGMPEWGMIPIPAKLAAAGVSDMVRVTDARMSGTSFGTVFLHAAPEAAIGGPLALVRDGDLVAVDTAAGTLDLRVPAGELSRRAAAWVPPDSPHLRGWPALYRDHVLQAPEGCDLDFLRAPTPAHRRFIEPVVGRS